MLKALVYHRTAFGAGGMPLFNELEHVATLDVLECYDPEMLLDVAFRHTNSINASWVSCPPPFMTVEPYAALGCRSTSVGDVVCVVADARPCWYVCAPVGWTPIPAPAGAPL